MRSIEDRLVNELQHLTYFKNVAQNLFPAHRVIPLFLGITALSSLHFRVDGGADSRWIIAILGIQLLLLTITLPALRLPADWPSKWVLSLFLLMLIWAFLSAFWSDHPTLVLRRSLLILIPTIGVFWLAVTDRRPDVTLMYVSSFTIGLAVFLVLGSILLSFGTVEVVEDLGVQSLSLFGVTLSQKSYAPIVFGIARTSSFTGNPNTFALWQGLALVSLWGLLGTRRLSTYTVAALLVVLLIGMWLSFSRGMILSLAATGAVILPFTMSGRKIWIAALPSFVLMGFCTFIAYFGFLSDDPRMIQWSFAGSERLHGWLLVLGEARNHYLSGVGFGVSYEAIMAPAGLGFGVHNIYLAILAETGSVGLGLFIGIFIVFFFKGVVFFRSRSGGESWRRDWPVFSVYALVTAIAVNQFFELGILRYNFLSFFWAVYLGLGLAMIRECGESQDLIQGGNEQ